MTESVRIFINEEPVDAPEGARLRDVIAANDPALAGALDAGTAYVTDGVGRPVPADEPAAQGAIYRVVRSARRAQGS